MRSIFWIGCILAILVSILASGAVAESVKISPVQEAIAQVENVTETVNGTAATVGETAAKAENLTDVAKQAAVAAGIPGAENVTDSVKEAVGTVGAVAEKVENATGTAKEILATVGAGDKANVTAPAAGGNATTAVKQAEPDLVNDTLVKFVKDARTTALGNGQAGALVAFRNPVGGYVNAKMYIFAYDYDGKVLANPVNPGIVGQNQIGLSDSTGFKYIQQMRDVARKGGFVTYQESNLMNKGIIEQKTSYVIDVDGTYWIGAGVFKSTKEAPAVKAPVTLAAPVKESNETVTTDVKQVEVSVPASNATESNVTAQNVTAVTA